MIPLSNNQAVVLVTLMACITVIVVSYIRENS